MRSAVAYPHAFRWLFLGVLFCLGCRGTGLKPSFWPGASREISSFSEDAGSKTATSSGGNLPPPSAAAVPSAVRTADGSSAPPAATSVAATATNPTTSNATVMPPAETPLPVTTYPATGYDQLMANPATSSSAAYTAQPPAIAAAAPVGQPTTSQPSIPVARNDQPYPSAGASQTSPTSNGNSLVQQGSYGYDASPQMIPPPIPNERSYSEVASATTWGGTSQENGNIPSASLPDLPMELSQSAAGIPPGTIYGEMPSAPSIVPPPPEINPSPGAADYVAGIPTNDTRMAQPVTRASYDASQGGNSHYGGKESGLKPWCPGSTSLIPGTR